MAIYTVGRRRVIAALLLSAALLLTLDLRGNPVLDTVRDGFSQAMSPVERATDVVTNPVQRGWNAYSNYDDLQRENESLQDRLDRQVGSQAAAEAAIIDYQTLLAVTNLPSLAGIKTEKAQVVGGATNNIDQIVEINKGSDQGIAIGMPVVNQAGLIGKITQVNVTTAKVMLITDPRYSVAVEILAGTGDVDADGEPVTENTTPSGDTPEENDEIVANATSTTTIPVTTDAIGGGEDPAAGDSVPDDSTTTGTTPLDVFGDQPALPESGDVIEEPTDSTPAPGDSLPEGETTGTDVEPELDENGDPVPTTTTTTTTTIPVVAGPQQLEKEFGTLGGRGQGRPSQIRYVQAVPSLAVLEVGDLVETAGGSESLAPPNIPIGSVINRADRPGVAGPLLEVELNADLDKLNFVSVVLYRPLSEVDDS